VSCTPKVSGVLYRLEAGGAVRLSPPTADDVVVSAHADDTDGNRVAGADTETASPDVHWQEKEATKAPPKGPTAARRGKVAVAAAASVFTARVPSSWTLLGLASGRPVAGSTASAWAVHDSVGAERKAANPVELDDDDDEQLAVKQASTRTAGGGLNMTS
jgi:hypothetical protein